MISKKLNIEYTEAEFSELDEVGQDAIRKAFEVSEAAYAPYSKFNVGACAVLDNGSMVLGSNQENAAYPSGMCAERVSLFSVGTNHPDSKVLILAVSVSTDTETDEPVPPCGACRQVMVETERRNSQSMKVLIGRPGSKVIIFESAESLLPLTFDGSFLS